MWSTSRCGHLLGRLAVCASSMLRETVSQYVGHQADSEYSCEFVRARSSAETRYDVDAEYFQRSWTLVPYELANDTSEQASVASPISEMLICWLINFVFVR